MLFFFLKLCKLVEYIPIKGRPQCRKCQSYTWVGTLYFSYWLSESFPMRLVLVSKYPNFLFTLFLSLLTMWLMETSPVSTFSHSFYDPENFLWSVCRIIFFYKLFPLKWQVSSANTSVITNKGSHWRMPFSTISPVSFVASLCSSSVKHWLSQSNWLDGFVIWDFRPVFSVTVLVVSGDQGQYQSLAGFLHFRVLSCLPDLLIVSQEFLTRVSFKYIFFSCNIGRKC